MVVGLAGTVGGYGRNALQIAIFRYFHGPSTLSTPKTYDRWVRRERYGESDLCEKSFQLSSLLIV
jgi:hypothetical protein